MKQLGNLAIVCATRKNVLFQVLDGKVTVYVGVGPDKAVLATDWDNDDEILDIVRELNFGNYKENAA